MFVFRNLRNLQLIGGIFNFRNMKQFLLVVLLLYFFKGFRFEKSCIITNQGLLELEILSKNLTNLNIYVCGKNGWSTIAFSTSPEVHNITYTIFINENHFYESISIHPQLFSKENLITTNSSTFIPKTQSSLAGNYFKMINFNIKNFPNFVKNNWTHVMFACHTTEPASTKTTPFLIRQHQKLSIISLKSSKSTKIST